MGAILTAYQIDAYQLTQFIRLGHVPVPVRQIDENTIVYAPAEGPFAVRVRLIHRGDPWFQSIDPALYRKWAEKISAEIESALVLTAQQYATWNEALLMTLADDVSERFSQYDRITAWDFQVSSFVPTDAIVDWDHEIRVIQGKEERYGPDNPAPWEKSKEQLDAEYEALFPKKRKRFWRALSVEQTTFQPRLSHNLGSETVVPESS